MKRIIISALALLCMGTCAIAQEKVTVHNGSESYVTTIEYITFDAPDAEEAVSVSALQTEITTLTGEKTALEGQVSTLTSEKATLQIEKDALETKVKSMEYALGERAKVHEYVDLGLTSGTLWATCNIGADAPEDYGGYFAWGETSPKSNYKTSAYFDTNDDGKTFVKYNINGGKTELEDADDIAVQSWGGAWRMPTHAQQDELCKECYWVWTTRTYNGKSVNGYIVYKAKKEGDKGVKVYIGNDADASYSVVSDAHIFLPAAGYRYSDKLSSKGFYGYFWSRSIGMYYYSNAVALYFYSGDVYADDDDFFIRRYYGYSVRPVCPAKE